ncbi:MAG: hypothetical protein ACHQ52_01155 [Candidatus Eisenbacteria bacterium]|jgi:hypothetical protein
MADKETPPSDDWGTVVAKWTFICTMVLAALYVGSVFLFILPR